MNRNKETLRNAECLKTGRLGTGRHQVFALKVAKGNVMTHMEEAVKIQEVLGLHSLQPATFWVMMQPPSVIKKI